MTVESSYNTYMIRPNCSHLDSIRYRIKRDRQIHTQMNRSLINLVYYRANV